MNADNWPADDRNADDSLFFLRDHTQQWCLYGECTCHSSPGLSASDSPSNSPEFDFEPRTAGASCLATNALTQALLKNLGPLASRSLSSDRHCMPYCCLRLLRNVAVFISPSIMSSCALRLRGCQLVSCRRQLQPCTNTCDTHSQDPRAISCTCSSHTTSSSKARSTQGPLTTSSSSTASAAPGSTSSNSSSRGRNLNQRLWLQQSLGKSSC